MAKINLKKLNLKELHELRANTIKEIDSCKKSELKKLRKDINQQIKENGFTLSEVFPSVKPTNKVSAKPKYRNPDNEGETWAGRGRKPKWLEEKLATGSTEEDFLIQ